MPDVILTPQTIKTFRKTVYDFFKTSGRHTLPWRQDHQPYKIMVSEIMLQQTQVDRVIPKFNEFIKTFPTIEDLAHAPLSAVIKQWQGLGYNRRGKFLHQAAQKIVADFNGQMPIEEKELLSLPGIGSYTAAAIQAFAFNKPVVIIETNVRTIFLYHFFADQDKVSDQELKPFVLQTLDTANPRQWYSALMDYGTYLKTVSPNPSRRSAHYTKQSTFKGSYRQVRGEILKALTLNDRLTQQQLLDTIAGDKTKFEQAAADLEKEGFITKNNTDYHLT
jgi:A/G-specific adenine glycosylase